MPVQFSRNSQTYKHTLHINKKGEKHVELMKRIKIHIKFWFYVWCISYSEWSETRRSFITITFELRFRICYQEGPRKLGKDGIKWNITAPCLCWQCQYTGQNHKYCTEK
jgi:hypothetical protein